MSLLGSSSLLSLVLIFIYLQNAAASTDDHDLILGILWNTNITKYEVNQVHEEVKEVRQSLDEMKQLLNKKISPSGDDDGCSKSEIISTSNIDINSYQDSELLFIGPGVVWKENRGSEVLSLPGFSNTNCSIPIIGNGYHGYVATLSADGPMMCGGRVGQSSVKSDCHLLIKNGIWVNLPQSLAMGTARTRAAAIQFEGVWWVTGGFNNNEYLRTTETWDGKRWHDHTYLPDPLSGHCLVRINTTHAFLAGGTTTYYQESFSTDAYLYSNDTGFVKQRTMLWSGNSLSCALVQEDLVMVAGGYKRKDTQFFNLATLAWSSGPDLPTALSGSKMFSIDGKTFFLGGFSDNGGGSKKIWQLVPLELSSMNWWRWAEVGELKDTKSHFDIVPITKEYCANNDS